MAHIQLIVLALPFAINAFKYFTVESFPFAFNTIRWKFCLDLLGSDIVAGLVKNIEMCHCSRIQLIAFRFVPRRCSQTIVSRSNVLSNCTCICNITIQQHARDVWTFQTRSTSKNDCVCPPNTFDTATVAPNADGDDGWYAKADFSQSRCETRLRSTDYMVCGLSCSRDVFGLMDAFEFL